MIDLPYSLTIEATSDPDYYSFYSPDLGGFSGSGASIEDCVARARAGMVEHVALLRSEQLPVPATNSHPRILIENTEPVRAA